MQDITSAVANLLKEKGASLTNAKLKCGEPVNVSKCGVCKEYLKICPAQTIKNTLWEPGVARDELINFAECRDKIIERGLSWNLKDGMCGLCIYACPYAKSYLES